MLTWVAIWKSIGRRVLVLEDGHKKSEQNFAGIFAVSGWESLERLFEMRKLRLHRLRFLGCSQGCIFNHGLLAMFSFCSNLGFPSEPRRCCLLLPKTHTLTRPVARNNALKSLKNYAAS